MAIDSKAKRWSMLGAASPLSVPLFEPDGQLDADDRFTNLHLYGGLMSPTTVQDTTYYICFIRSG